MSEVHSPHDRFAKELISRPESARSLVREYLPREVVDLLDISPLAPASSSWVDAELQEHFADQLFQCGWARKLRGLKPRFQVYVLLLVEHKSHPDRFVRLQLLRYLLQCWTEHLKHGRLPLPIVIPLVLYHGKSRWKYSRQFSELFGDFPEEFRRFVPQFEFELLDVSPQSGTPIVGNPLTRVSLSLLREAHHADTAALKAELPNLLAQLPLEQALQLEFMQPIFQYLSSTRMLKVEDMGEALRQAFPQQESLMKSFVEELLEEGMEKGLKIGREEGREMGREEGLGLGRATILQLLRLRFGEKAVTKTLASRIEKLSLSDLEQLGDELLKFKSPADLQRWLASRK